MDERSESEMRAELELAAFIGPILVRDAESWRRLLNVDLATVFDITTF